MKKLLYWLTAKLPCRIISDDGVPYLERYYLGTLFNVRFYIHRFVGSDPARGLHDHPWPWAISLILSGFYYEETRSGLRKVKWINRLTGDSFHRVILSGNYVREELKDMGYTDALPREKECWTLFFHYAEYTKPWGFLRKLEAKADVGVVDTARLWVPHNYPKDGGGSAGEWWRYVPLGHTEPRRMPLGDV